MLKKLTFFIFCLFLASGAFAATLKDTTVTGDLTVTGTVSGNGSLLTNVAGALSGLNPGYLPRSSTSTTVVDSGVYQDVNGNVGIGTTVPIQPLHVNGHCVTGDTRLRRRRRKSLPPGGGGDDEYIYDDVRIDEIQPGDEILTVNDATGVFVYAPVKQLMDMGIRDVYQLKTSSGKKIRTTAEHPYLVKPLVKKLSGTFEADQSNRIEDLSKDSYIALANTRHAFVVSIMKAEKRRAAAFYKKDAKKFGPVLWARAIANILMEENIHNAKLVLDEEYKGYEGIINQIIYGTGREVSIEYRRVGKNSAAHLACYSANPATKGNKKPTGALSVRQVAEGALHPELTGIRVPSSRLHEVYHQLEGVSSAAWKKVDEVFPGQEVATADGWEKIAYVRKVGREQVWDIEVEGTHNFVGNDIIAHNTYINGNLGIGTTAPRGKLEVDGTTYLMSGNVGISSTGPRALLEVGNAANVTAGSNAAAIIKNDLIVDGKIYGDGSGLTSIPGSISGLNTGYISRANTSTAIVDSGIYQDASGNIGIGTTAPGAQLNLVKADSTGLTDLLVNPAVKTSGYLMNLQVGGASKFSVNRAGSISAGTNSNINGSLSSFLFTSASSMNTTYVSPFAGGDSPANITSRIGVQIGGFGYSSGYSDLSTGGNQVWMKIAPVYNQAASTAANTDLLISRTQTAVGSGAQLLIDAQVYGASQFRVTNAGLGYFAGNLGVGSTAPQQKLDVEGSVYLGSGNVGINTTGTRALLEVGTAASVTAGSNAAAIIKNDLVVDGKIYGDGSGLTSVAGALSGLTSTRVPVASASNALVDSVIYNVGNNVGIGTSAPAQKLHVEGHCVTGDSILQIVRDDNATRPLRIDQVKGGEWILSLDEKTGFLVPARVKGLLDMGVKPVFRIRTSDDRVIWTTGNHPYLVKLAGRETGASALQRAGWEIDGNVVAGASPVHDAGWIKVAGLNVGDEIAVTDGVSGQALEPQDGIFDNGRRDEKATGTVERAQRLDARVQRQPLPADRQRNDANAPVDFNAEFRGRQAGLAVIGEENSVAVAAGQKKASGLTRSEFGPFYEGQRGHLIIFGNGRDIQVGPVFDRGQGSLAGFAGKFSENRLGEDDAAEMLEKFEVPDLLQMNEGAGVNDEAFHDPFPSQRQPARFDAVLPPVLPPAAQPVLPLSGVTGVYAGMMSGPIPGTGWPCLSPAPVQLPSMAIPSGFLQLPSIAVPWSMGSYRSPLIQSYHKGDVLSSRVTADVSGAGFGWSRIVAIEFTGYEQVWDIEVEGTHNFVANGIIAHNTYINGNVGIGTTAPTQVLGVNGVIAHVWGSPIPSLSGCGTGPTIKGTDNAFEIVVGTSATGCTATFAGTYGDAVCTVTNQSVSVVNAMSYTVSASAVTITQANSGGDKIDVYCDFKN